MVLQLHSVVVSIIRLRVLNPESVEGDKVNIKIGTLQRLVSFWGLRFTDEDNNKLSNIDSVYVSNIKASGVLDLTKNSFVNDDEFEESRAIAVVPAKGTKLLLLIISTLT